MVNAPTTTERCGGEVERIVERAEALSLELKRFAERMEIVDTEPEAGEITDVFSAAELLRVRVPLLASELSQARAALAEERAKGERMRRALKKADDCLVAAQGMIATNLSGLYPRFTQDVLSVRSAIHCALEQSP